MTMYHVSYLGARVELGVLPLHLDRFTMLSLNTFLRLGISDMPRQRSICKCLISTIDPYT